MTESQDDLRSALEQLLQPVKETAALRPVGNVQI